ncbi:urocanate hydratase [Cutibacterium acnes JCM 18918]|nr:urocanate hydratase [Cutibacterium acnes JCM 18918]
MARPVASARISCSTGSSKKYLSQLTEDTTLVVMSGHPLGLFPSRPESPRVIITNSLMVGHFDNQKDWEICEEMGVANYGQMTAGGWMYIGPQASSMAPSTPFSTPEESGWEFPLTGISPGCFFVSSGLGGMSGAQPKAAEIAHAVGIIAEVDMSRIQTRLDQGWVGHVSDDLDEVFALAKKTH